MEIDPFILDIMLQATFIFLLLVLVVWLPVTGYLEEKIKWNNGVCEESGKKWMKFDVASDGSRGYTDGDENYTWISWGVDKSY